MIGEFIDRWRAGTHIVLGVSESKRLPMGMRLFRAIGYGVLSRVSEYRVIPNATGFGLYDRAVVDCLKQWRDPEPFFRGMLVESGFSLETIPFVRPPRAAGQSKNDFFKLIDLGLSGIATASSQLLRAPLYISPFVFALAGLAFVVGIALFFVGRGSWVPFLLALCGACFGVTLVFLGLMGEQVRLIAKTVRGEPLVVEKERVNFPAARQ
jgi:hypothetical protein